MNSLPGQHTWEYLWEVNIYLYDLEKSTKFKIAQIETNSESLKYLCPSIYKSKIAYGDANKIYLYDINTANTTELTEIDPLINRHNDDNIGALKSLNLGENQIKYLQVESYDAGFDMYTTTGKCTLMNIDLKEKKDITCNGGDSDWIFNYLK